MRLIRARSGLQQMLIGGYQIQEQIGRGGMASVYLAVQESLNRPVALKVLTNPNVPEFSERFLSEGRIIASLNHSNIVTIYDIGIDNDHHYLSMEYVTGGDLATRIVDKIPPKTALDIVEKIGGALHAAHDKGIIHRDVKPANILFRDDGTPLLTDFGIAKQPRKDQNLTVTGGIIGTPFYLSPEQAHSVPLDGRADLYSLGIVFYEMLVGQKPYRGESDINIIFKHLHDPLPKLPKELHELQSLLNNMIAKAKEDRFGSLAEMVEFTQALRRSDSIIARDAATGEENPLGLARTRIGDQRPARWPYLANVWSVPRWLLGIAGFGVLLVLVMQIFPGNDRENIWRDVETLLNSDSEGHKQNIQESSHIGPERRNPKETSKNSSNAAISAEELAASQPTDAKRSANIQQSTKKDTQSAPPRSALPRSVPPRNALPIVEERHVLGRVNQHSRTGPTSIELSDKIAKPGGGGSKKAQQKVNALIALAEERLREYKLITPKDDNALYYYSMAQNLDPSNYTARHGFRKVAARYAVLAEQELSRRRYVQAKKYIDLGLDIDPGHRRLQILNGRVQIHNTSQRVANSAKGFFNSIKRTIRENW